MSIVVHSLSEGLALMGTEGFDASYADHSCSTIGRYNGETVVIDGWTTTQFYDLGCLALMGIRRPLERLAAIGEGG